MPNLKTSWMKSAKRLNKVRRRVPRLDFLARSIVEGYLTGLHRSPFHGYSAEFAEHKMYAPGEPIRFIDWKVYAKTGKFFIKKFDEETNMQVQFILDASPSMYYPQVEPYDLDRLNKIGFSVVAVAALCEILRRQRDAVGLSVFDEQLQLSTAAKTNTLHRQRILAELEKFWSRTPGRQGTALARNLHLIAEQLRRRSVAVLFTDFWATGTTMDAWIESLKHLRYKTAELLFFHVSDAETEDLFRFPDRPLRFRDLETGQSLNLYPSEIRAHYVRRRREMQQRLRDAAYRYDFDYYPVDVRTPFDEVLSAYLQKRLRMHG